jgi:hypothetical protein
MDTWCGRKKEEEEGEEIHLSEKCKITVSFANIVSLLEEGKKKHL